MYYAVNAEGKRVFIEDAQPGDQYFCPQCGELLVQKKGSMREHHFAHMMNIDCDPWKYDMSEWHRSWQSLFPESTREVVVQYDGEKHRADVLVGRTVIEFQHSPMTSQEFWKRNYFYRNAGYFVMWIFDMIDEFNNEKIICREDKDGIFQWKYHWHTFDGFQPNKEKGISLFFQMHKDGGVIWGIERVVWLAPNGKWFRTKEGEAYNNAEIVELFVPKNNHKAVEEKKFTIADLHNVIAERKVKGEWCVPCPMKQGGYESFENCPFCIYSTRCFAPGSIGKLYKDMYEACEPRLSVDYSMGCLYEFREIIEGWDLEHDKVNKILYDSTGRVIEFDLMKAGRRLRQKRIPANGKNTS